jgi:NAD dependent epimerase/dehydratase family enzyme
MQVPVVTHAPKWALRGALGELADGLLIASLRAMPRKLQECGYTFQDPEAEATFRWLLAEIDAPRP